MTTHTSSKPPTSSSTGGAKGVSDASGQSPPSTSVMAGAAVVVTDERHTLPVPRSALSRRALLAGSVALCAAGGFGAFVQTARRSRVVREVVSVVPSSPHVDGAGVQLRKILGGRALPLLDPFLMLDEFKSDRPEDYVAGFPTHPHRGFETVTIMLAGEVAHQDSVGNQGIIAGGGVQWMTAGRGILHSEMPTTKTSGGLLHGYQLWVNLPARQKMTSPRYQEFSRDAFPWIDVDESQVRVLAGRLNRVRGPIEGVATAPLVLDATLGARGRLRHDIEPEHAAAIYVVAGAVAVGEAGTSVAQGHLAVLSSGDVADIRASSGSRVLLLAGRPLREPVARRGPFVMNTAAELDRAVADYRSGRLVGG
jgi:redox-sensitive bicupin YhaK (pirin superfamily)